MRQIEIMSANRTYQQDLKGLNDSSSSLDQEDLEEMSKSSPSRSDTRRRPPDRLFEKRASSFSSLGDLSGISSTSERNSSSSRSVSRRRPPDRLFEKRNSSMSSLGDLSGISATSDRPSITRSQSDRVRGRPVLERASSSKARMLTGTTNAYYHSSIFAPTPNAVAKREKLENKNQEDKSSAAVDFLRQLCSRHDSGRGFTSNSAIPEETPKNLYVNYRNENLKRRKSWDGLKDDIEMEIAAEQNRSLFSKCFTSIRESFSSTIMYMRIYPRVCIALTFCLIATVVCAIVLVSTQGRQSTLNNITVGDSDGDGTNIVSHEQQIKILSSVLKSTWLLKHADTSVYDDPDSPQHKAITWVTSHTFPSDVTKFQNGVLVKPGDGMMTSLMYSRNGGIPSGTFDDYFRIEAIMERYAVAVLYYSTIGINETFAEFNVSKSNEHFSLAHENVCKWKGVTCHEFHEIVSHLDMGSTLLYGTLPPELAYLRSLKSLDFSDNSLHGTIPVDFGTFPSIGKMLSDFESKKRKYFHLHGQLKYACYLFAFIQYLFQSLLNCIKITLVAPCLRVFVKWLA